MQMRFVPSRKPFRPLSQGIVALSLVAGLISAPLTSWAQSYKEKAPTDVAAVMTARAVQVLQAVGELSPMPASTDADRAQRWPRLPYWEKVDPTTGGIVRVPRDPSVQVVGEIIANDPKLTPAWTVKLVERRVAVAVQPGGRIVGFFDFLLSELLQAEPPPRPEDCIGIEAANARALAYARHCGIDPATLVLWDSQLFDHVVPASAGTRRLEMNYRRVWHGVPFNDQFVSVSLEPRYGRLFSMGAAWMDYTPPTSANPVLSAEQAVNSAVNATAARGYKTIGAPTFTLEIVLPRADFGKPGQLACGPNKQTKLAWIVRLPMSDSWWADVWVDAESGAIIGGDRWALRGKAASDARSPLLSALRSAVEVTVKDTQGKRLGSVSRTSVKEALSFYGALAQASPLPEDRQPSAFKSAATLVLKSGKGKIAQYPLDPVASIAFDGAGTYVKVPVALRNLMGLSVRSTTASTKRKSR